MKKNKLLVIFILTFILLYLFPLSGNHREDPSNSSIQEIIAKRQDQIKII